jgi:hypothetical protein
MEDETQNGKQHPWKTVTKKKRKLTKVTNQIQDNTAQVKTTNKFQALANTNYEIPKEENTSTNHTNNDKPKDPKPPPIYIYGVTNDKQMIDNISQIGDQETYHTKTF